MKAPADILERILARKREEIAERQHTHTLADLYAQAGEQSAPRGFAQSLSASIEMGRAGVIAEVKKASPSKGLIREDFDPASIAASYQAGGASCLSVLTDRDFFQGAESHLVAARAACTLPVLRKDFMIDPYQVTEARAIGADCILLIMAVLDDGLAREMADAAASFDMDVLVEVHDEAELERAALLGTGLIGINNRNLRTLKTDIAVTEQLAPLAPKDAILVSESGIRTADDLSRMAAACAGGPRCFLVGESLMRQVDVTQATRELLSQKSSLQKDSDHG